MSIEQPQKQKSESHEASGLMDDAAFGALQMEVGELRSKLEKFEKKDYPYIGHSFQIDEIRDDVAKRLDLVVKNKNSYPQFAEELDFLEKTRGLRPGVTRTSLVVGAVIGASDAPYTGLRTLFDKDMLAQYHELSVAKNREQLQGVPKEIYEEFETKSKRLAEEEARRANLSSAAV